MSRVQFTKFRRQTLKFFSLFSLVIVSTSCDFSFSTDRSQLTNCINQGGSSVSPEDKEGACTFLHEDWNTLSISALNTNVIPIQILTVAMVLSDKKTKALRDPVALKQAVMDKQNQFFRKIGLFTPSKIANLPDLKFESNYPMGVASGDIHFGPLKVKGIVFSCASCHAGRLYDSEGKPTTEAWLGAPNSSYFVDELLKEVYSSLITISHHWDEFMEIYQLSYGLSDYSEEILTLRVLKNSLLKSLAKLESTTKAFRPFRIGSPGDANGIATIELNLGLYKHPEVFNGKDMASVSIISLFDRVFRSSYLVDGVYRVYKERNKPISEKELANPDFLEQQIKFTARVATLFTIGTVGADPDQAFTFRDKVESAFKTVSKLGAPHFPGTIDPKKAQAGEKIYAQSCQSCHGTYAPDGEQHFKLIDFPNKAIPVNEINTNRERITRVGEDVINKAQALKVASGVIIEKHESYIAPILTGLWLTAPYLHNGSVPSIYQLMHPEKRAAKFIVGGHDLDYVNLGIRPSNQPFSKPNVFDTTQMGQGNAGHEFPFNRLSETEKWNLIEFLKEI